ncbi:MAG: fasciclin domain-containing protein [Dysgonamonadaceae bacterium]|jgi:uncharacterized surface protein with fasciclin (FAS1) repeats|nr:fasciclin domain-containing protein [Dysgonamonadaceae bacterium]
MNKLNNSLFFLGIIFCIYLTSCKDEYFYENNIPTGLGKSIYDYLQNEAYFTDYLRLIDDLEYAEVLAKTGSKTLFVADDEAFKRFYDNNPWNVRGYEDLSLAQKKLIMNSSMINNALLIENLSTIEGPVDGQVLRRATALSVSDTIPFETGSALPGNVYWDRFRETGIFLAKDNTPIPMLHFLESQMTAHNITNEDFSILFNGQSRSGDDAYIYNIKVKQRDIVCQNGYIHVLEEVLIPPSNMAEVILNAPETSMFSSFMERFAAPYYNATLTEQHSLLGGTDSVFVKGYFAERSSIVPLNSSVSCEDPNGNAVNNILLFDPGWNRYYSSNVSGSFQTDMAAIFAPSDEALRKYFETGAGRPLVERYGSIENIPNEILDKLIRNHTKSSFLGALPSQFHTIVDDAQEKMGVEKSHVDKVYLASNGAVYVMNTVYSPALYSSVMFPATINENMKIFNWAIDQLEFDAYLLSMVNYYSFLLPEDNFTYIPPTSYKYAPPQAWIFHYQPARNNMVVYASIHPYDPDTQAVGDSIGFVTNTAILKDHLEDMLDYHIVVGNIEEDREYYRTKGGGTIRVTHNNNRLQVAGGGDIARNTTIPVTEIYDQTKETNGRGNGKTYVVNQPVQTPLQSVYEILSTTKEFREFFILLQGNDDLWIGDDARAAKFGIFYRDASKAGMDVNVRFLNTYHYTLYVPTNEEVQKAIRNGLPTWDDVEATNDQDERDALAEKIVRFLRYHFQDNSVFIDKPAIADSTFYETATLNNLTKTFYKLKLEGGNYSLKVKTERTLNETDDTKIAHVKKDGGLFNIMARDFKFDTPSPQAATMIETSSYIVIHQIDKCLFFE